MSQYASLIGYNTCPIGIPITTWLACWLVITEK